MLGKSGLGMVLGGCLLIGGGSGVAHAAPSTAPSLAVDDGKVDVAVSAGGQQIGVIDNVAIVNAVTLVNSVCPAAGITAANLMDLDTNNAAVGRPCTGTDGMAFKFTQNTAGASSSSSARSKSS